MRNKLYKRTLPELMVKSDMAYCSVTIKHYTMLCSGEGLVNIHISISDQLLQFRRHTVGVCYLKSVSIGNIDMVDAEYELFT